MPEGLELVSSAVFGTSNGTNNMEATAAPTENDDETKGFSIYSVWFKKNTGDWWYCTSATAGAATWAALE